MGKYDELDRVLLNKIGDGPTPFCEFGYSYEVSKHCGAVRYPAQLVDRRLQFLRKKGMISSSWQGWRKIQSK